MRSEQRCQQRARVKDAPPPPPLPPRLARSQARKNNRLGPDVDLARIAALTKNFSGAEIEGSRDRLRGPRATAQSDVDG